MPGKSLKRFFGTLLDLADAARQIPYLLKQIDSGASGCMGAVSAPVQQAMRGSAAFVILISGADNRLQLARTAQQVKDEQAGLLFSRPLPGYLVDPPFPLYHRDARFARLPVRLAPRLVIHGMQDLKTPYDATLRHIGALRRARKVRLFSAEGSGCFVLWSDTGCARGRTQLGAGHARLQALRQRRYQRVTDKQTLSSKGHGYCLI